MEDLRVQWCDIQRSASNGGLGENMRVVTCPQTLTRLPPAFKLCLIALDCHAASTSGHHFALAAYLTVSSQPDRYKDEEPAVFCAFSQSDLSDNGRANKDHQNHLSALPTCEPQYGATWTHPCLS